MVVIVLLYHGVIIHFGSYEKYDDVPGAKCSLS